jgi:hypothetical protein
MLIHSAEITGSVQFNNTDVSGITNVAGFATTASVDALVVKTGSYASTSSVNELQSKTGSYTSTSSFGGYTSSINTFTSSATTRLNTIESVTGSYASTSSVNNLQSVTGSYATTSSFGAYTSSNDSTNTTQNTRLSTIESVTGSYASTGSNQFNGNQSISGSITSNGTITAQTLVVQTVTSSVEFITGSTKNGSLAENTHQFTGSVLMTGSLSVTTTGTELQVNASGVNIGNALTDSHIISGSVRINPDGLFVSSSGNVGVGTAAPKGLLDVRVSVDRSVTFTGTLSGESIISSTQGDVTSNLRELRISSRNLYFNTGDATTTGTQRMILTQDGNVGIGTTSPNYKFVVSKGGAEGMEFDAGTIIAGRNYIINYNRSTNAYTDFQIDANNIIFGTAGTERMRITSTGALMVGASSNNTSSDISTIAQLIAPRGTITYPLTLSTAGTGVVNDQIRMTFNYGTAYSATAYIGSFLENVSTAATSLVFGTYGASLTERMRISSTGVVTKPFNPAFRAYHTTNGGVVLAADDTFVFNATEYNIGSCYNTSNGRFTAPVAGVYQINFYSIILGAYNNGELWFLKNGANLTSGTRIHFSTNAGNTWDNVHFVTSVYLNSGDYVSFVNKAQSVTYHGLSWSSFSGYLVG